MVYLMDRVMSLTSGNWHPLSATDFVQGLGLNFAADRDIAEHFACYVKRRDKVQSVAIVQITIQNSAIESLSVTELLNASWPSNEWKSLVFHGRLDRQFPEEMRKFGVATLVIGTIARMPTWVHGRISGS